MHFFCTHACPHVYTHVHTHVHTHVRVCTHVHMHVDTHVSTHVRMHISTHVHTHVYTHAYTHASTVSPHISAWPRQEVPCILHCDGSVPEHYDSSASIIPMAIILSIVVSAIAATQTFLPVVAAKTEM